MPEFSHLHVHTQFSLLDGAADIGKLFKKAAADGMKAMAITDHGNMFGAFKFVAEANKHNVKPIVGCEFYVVEDRHKKQFTKELKDKRCHQLLLAKNAEGYKNLVKLCSLGYMEGLYSKWPRIDKELIEKYHKGLIATTCCIGASVPQAILHKGEEDGEKEFKWWLDLFGEDYYIELQRHNIPDQEKVNKVLLKFAAKHNVKVICSNDSHYVDQQDANAHDILLCVNTGDVQSTPMATDEESGKGYRFGFPNDQFYFKTQAEMGELFHDLPEALDNTSEIVDKVDSLKLKKDILLPNFPVPPEFDTQDAYLEHLTFTGAKARYKEITQEVEERLNFELFTIKTMGFAGYFLIVADFIRAGRDLGVFIGPGRGSAAGSVVAYCIGITNIDPIKYNLLFERFLNPDRKSMPDIDTDFDDEGRQKVIDYVVDKYGKNQVAQIITYGTMAAKTSIQDVARVMEMPLPESSALKKLVPERLGIELGRVLNAPFEGEKSLKEKEALNPEEIENVKKLREYLNGDSLEGKVLREAEKLEGSVRNVGIHAAGIIIAPQDLTELIPVATAKDSDLLVTQFDGKVIEDAGVIKMDFLGLKTLTIIKGALKMIQQNHGVTIDIDAIPLDDQKTLELYQRGDTNGTFQFESDGMQQWLRQLRPDKFEDLIAMNALYRPGPMEYIPDYVDRKHGRQEVSYDLQEMEEYLADTYGITVYQEQVMLLSQKIAGFTKGQADTLRKAMGKKDKKTLDGLREAFMSGAQEKGHDAKVLEKVWTDWEAFAQYAFNKSHSTCYAFVAYQTAYLKAHYPGEYMSAVLNNQGNLDKISFFMEECRRMSIPVLGPDVNESDMLFAVNKKGEIRFGLGGIKGVGEKAVENIIEERENGAYTSIFEFARRVNSRTVNKKSYESLVYSGAFDGFPQHRAQYFGVSLNDKYNGIERVIKYANDYQENKNSSQASLFGGAGSSTAATAEPQLPDTEKWSLLEQLKFEKDVVGFYISGHPLDNFKLEMVNFCSHTIRDVKLIEKAKNGALEEEEKPRFEQLRSKDIKIGGLIASAAHRITKTGKPFGTFILEDYNESIEIALFGDDYVKFRQFLQAGYFLHIRGKVDVRFRQEGAWEFKVVQIELLNELRDKLAKSLTVMVRLDQLSEDLINLMADLIENQKPENQQANCLLKFEITDSAENIKVELPSKRFKVNPDDAFLNTLKQELKLNYRLN